MKSATVKYILLCKSPSLNSPSAGELAQRN